LEGACPNGLKNFEEILSRARGNFEEKNKVLESFMIIINYFIIIAYYNYVVCRSEWPRRLRLRSTVARLLSLWVRIPPGAWMSVCCEC